MTVGTKQATTPFSRIITNRLPQFVKNDHPVFVEFMRQYYVWMETHGPLAATDNLLPYRDIDKTEDAFVDHFMNAYMAAFPKTILADKRLAIKHIRDMYRAKGTERAFQLFFRILFNEDVDFYYPKVDMLRISDGKWQQPNTIRVFSPDATAFQFQGLRISGEITGATAIVENVVQFYVGSNQIAEMYLSDISGTFQSNEKISTLNNGQLLEVLTGYVFASAQITHAGTEYLPGDPIQISGGSGVDAKAAVRATSKGSIESFTIVSPGTQYAVGEFLTFTNVDGCTEALAKISAVDGGGGILSINLLTGGYNYDRLPSVDVASVHGTGAVIVPFGSKIGGVLSIDITNFGFGYITPPHLSLTGSGDGTATLVASTGPVCAYSGQYIATDGFLDNNKIIQDSLFYQDFSYQLRTGTSIGFYSDLVKRLLHPAGMALFGSVLLSSVVDLEITPLTLLLPSWYNRVDLEVTPYQTPELQQNNSNVMWMSYARFDQIKLYPGDADGLSGEYDNLVFVDFEVNPTQKRFPFAIGSTLTLR
jgi:hypothetical protein